MISHTITIEPWAGYPGCIETRAVVERFNRRIVSIPVRADQLADPNQLEPEAERYARMYGAEYVTDEVIS